MMRTWGERDRKARRIVFLTGGNNAGFKNRVFPLTSLLGAYSTQ